jgi:hypothetical protein
MVIIVLAASVLVGIGIVAIWPSEREPEYNGKKLSEWCLGNWWWVEPGEREEARVAIDHIGTNALPFLIKWLRYDHPSPKEKVADVFVRLKDRLRGYTAARNSLRLPVRAQVAVFGFDALGTNASPAIPTLTMVIRDRASSATTTEAAAGALACMGPKGVRTLAELLNDPMMQPRRLSLVAGLISYGQREPTTADVLMRFVHDPDLQVAFICVGTLGRFQPAPAGAVACLKKSLADSRPSVRLASIDSLANFGKEASSAVPELLQTLQDSDATVRKEATNALLKIAPQVVTNGVKDF